jgi:hypothetical protein
MASFAPTPRIGGRTGNFLYGFQGDYGALLHGATFVVSIPDVFRGVLGEIDYRLTLWALNVGS